MLEHHDVPVLHAPTPPRSFIKPDQTVELYRGGLALIGLLGHGLEGRFNKTALE